MQKSGIPVIPGSDGEIKSIREARALADKIGYPVMIKACAGGGGKGMRAVYSAGELENAVITARNEAKAAFGDGQVYMESC